MILSEYPLVKERMEIDFILKIIETKQLSNLTKCEIEDFYSFLHNQCEKLVRGSWVTWESLVASANFGAIIFNVFPRKSERIAMYNLYVRLGYLSYLSDDEKYLLENIALINLSFQIKDQSFLTEDQKELITNNTFSELQTKLYRVLSFAETEIFINLADTTIKLEEEQKMARTIGLDISALEKNKAFLRFFGDMEQGLAKHLKMGFCYLLDIFEDIITEKDAFKTHYKKCKGETNIAKTITDAYSLYRENEINSSAGTSCNFVKEKKSEINSVRFAFFNQTKFKSVYEAMLA